MASTYTTGFGIEKIGSGEQDGAWGDTTNHNLDILDRIASYKAVAITTNADTATLTVREASPGSGTENLQDGMYRVIKFTGALDSTCTVTIAPNTAPAWFIIENATSGSQSLILSQGSGANVTVQNGKNVVIYCDGAGSGAAVVNALSDLQIATLEVTGAAAIDGALTGSSTIQGTTITATTAFVPDASDGAALGTTALEFSDLYLADGAVAAFGDDQDVTLTHVADTGLLLNSTRQLQFGDSGTYIHQSADGVLDLVSDTEIEINATTIDINGAVALNGAITGATNITLSGELDAATGDFSGAVDIDGALDVAGTTNLDVVDIDGAVNIAATTTVSAANKVQFRDAAIYLNSSVDGQLDIVADTEIQIAATNIDINGAVALSGAVTGATNITLSGELDAATGDFSGAVDIAGALTLGTDLAVAQGGTGASTFAANGILYGAGTGAIAATAVGTDGHVLTSNGSGVAPTFQAAGGVSDINGLSDALTNSSGATIGLGTGALAADDGSANNNTAVGYQALNDINTGSVNVGFGYQAGDKITTGVSNVALGAGSMGAVTTTSSNVAIGDRAMESPTGSNNTFVGKSSGEGGGGAASGNAALGYGSLEKITTGNNNVAVGYGAGLNITSGGTNTMLGYSAGDAVTTAVGSVAIGHNSMATTTTGNYNIAIGNDALNQNTTGANNVAIGNRALYGGGTSTASNNIAIGEYALDDITTGNSNVAIGYTAGWYATTGTQNTLVGGYVGRAVTTGSNNTFLGWEAGSAGEPITTGDNNLVLGYQASASAVGVDNEITLGNTSITKFRIPGLNFIIKDSTATDNYVLTVDSSGEAGWEAAAAAGATDINGLSDALTNSSGGTIGIGTGALAADDGSANLNTAVGFEALNDATTGHSNTAVGNQAMPALTTGHSNNAFGHYAAGALTTGNQNNAFGAYTLNRATTGANNNVFGYNAGEVITSGSGNVLMGQSAGTKLTTGNNNVFMGTTAGRYHTTGINNVGIGYKAMLGTHTAASTGRDNVAIGSETLGAYLTSGEYNTVIGSNASRVLTTGTHNTSVGTSAGYNLTTGVNNVAIGNSAMYYAATSAQITAVGSGALNHATGDNNTGLGHDAGKALTTGTNNMVLGFDAAASAVGVDNEITLGNTNVDKFRIPGLNFIIKDSTATDNYVLTVDASGEAGWEAAAGGATDWEVISSTGSVSAGTYLEITGFNMVRLQAVSSVTGTAHSGGINLSTSGSSNSGVSTQHGQLWRTYLGTAANAATPVNQTGAYSPSTSTLYYGSNDSANTNSNLELNLYGLDETNVGIMAQEQSVSSNSVNRWTGQTTSGSSTWFLYFSIAMESCLVVGCK